MIIQFFYFIIIVLIGLSVPKWFLRPNEKKRLKTLRILFIYQLVFSVGFYFFSRNNAADAWNYWVEGSHLNFSGFLQFIKIPGTFAMIAFNTFFANVLGMNYLINTMAYAVIGHIGIVIYFLLAERLIPYNYKIFNLNIFPLLFFIPSLHFWASGIGKDTLLFTSIAMLFYTVFDFRKKFMFGIIGGLIVLLIRPHISAIFLASLSIPTLFSKKISRKIKIVLTLVIVVGALVFIPKIMVFVKVDEFTLDAISNRIEYQSKVLAVNAGSAIDMSGYPFPLRLFTFLFRPLLFDVHTLFSLYVAIENTLLLIISIIAFSYKPIKIYRKAPFIIAVSFWFVIIGSILFSYSMGNFGIITRMRNMFLPLFLIYILWVFSSKRQLTIIGNDRKY